uniref:ATP synthase complex subunit 8 n=1 Tax=Kyklioacalles aubei TaxID=501594 RepID=J9PHS0_9CUCU|nr:ATP synthase F0 subunit 8 [Kyklioacalles aubei]
MPQMAPLNWTLTYWYFICLFFISIIMNYYMFMYNPKNKILLKKNKMNWKW